MQAKVGTVNNKASHYVRKGTVQNVPTVHYVAFKLSMSLVSEDVIAQLECTSIH